MKLKNILIKVFAGVLVCSVFMFAGCTLTTSDTLGKLETTATRIYSTAEDVKETEAPTYTTTVSTYTSLSDLANTVATNSTAMLEKSATLGTTLLSLSETITELKAEIKRVVDANLKLSDEDLQRVEELRKELVTIEKNLKEKKAAVEQNIDTIKDQISDAITNVDVEDLVNNGLENIVNTITDCYQIVFNAFDYVNTNLNNVETKLNEVVTILSQYEEQSAE